MRHIEIKKPCNHLIIKALKVRGKRFELSRPFERYHLKVVRLPISPPTHNLPGQNFEVAAKIGFSVKFSADPAYFLRTIRKVVPFPGSECRTKSSPLWYCSIMRLERLNPSPQPLFLVVKPGLKTF